MTAAATLVAVDIGNSRIKLGRFERSARGGLPAPAATFDLPFGGGPDGVEKLAAEPLVAWCGKHVPPRAAWLVASVHRGAAEWLEATVAQLAGRLQADWPLRRVTYPDVSLTIRVEEPAPVGIDRLLAAYSADRLRDPKRAAIVVDHGSAITVDLVSADGAFCGGAILPGIAMSARALAEQTDALPRLPLDQLAEPPAPLGTSTVAAIESGLYWGAIGAIRELVSRLAADLDAPPDVFISGGAARVAADVLAANEPWSVRHVPNLVLAGIALVGHAK